MINWQSMWKIFEMMSLLMLLENQRPKIKANNRFWQVKKTKGGPVILEPGTSRQAGLNNMGSKDDIGQRKPSDKAVGLHNSVVCGSSVVGSDELPLIKAVGLQNVLSPLVDEINSAVKHFKKDGPIASGPTVKPKGSGYFDVSRNVSGPGPSPNVNTKNSFGTLRDEKDCFDTDLGMWEREIEMVKKFVETNTRPKIEEYSSWSENMRKYYDGLTKVNGNEAEVESETDEMARFMK
ncbi:hypothetical protein HanHA300_Chr12g0455251 [Helianthus annuus]|nr:hypothetical protein HanHA300_Chr12g0455251 [Helianthus annuus]KAJ0494619.1 hypothetical protein HanIR_Chr12g0599521 [Helianthus annuus]KAJ0506338.1 hypothetical protein HanHA89_Chr12g0480831 [Helianthus annuus]